MKEQFIAIASIDKSPVRAATLERVSKLSEKAHVELTEIVAPGYARKERNSMSEHVDQKVSEAPVVDPKKERVDEVKKSLPHLLKDAVDETQEKPQETKEEQSSEQPVPEAVKQDAKEKEKEEVKKQTTLERLLAFLADLFGDKNPLVKRTEDFVHQVSKDVTPKELAQMYLDWTIPAYAPDIPKEEKEVADIVRLEIQGVAQARGMGYEFGKAISELRYGKKAEVSTADQQKAIVDELRSLHRELVEPTVRATGELQDHDDDKTLQKQLAQGKVDENTPEDVKKRFERAEDELTSLSGGEKRALTDEERAAIWEAHQVGKGEDGKNGSKAGVYNFTPAQLLNKFRILQRKNPDGAPIFTKEEIRVLMEGGVVGGINERFLGTGLDTIELEGIVRDPIVPENERATIDQLNRIVNGESYGEVINAPGRSQFFDIDNPDNFFKGQAMVNYYAGDHSVANGGILRPVDSGMMASDQINITEYTEALRHAREFYQSQLLDANENWNDNKYSTAFAKWTIQKNFFGSNINKDLVEEWDANVKAKLFYRANLEHRSPDKILDSTEALLEKALVSLNINPESYYKNTINLNQQQMVLLLDKIEQIGSDTQEMERLYMMTKRDKRANGANRRFNQQGTGSNMNNPDNPGGGGGFNNAGNGGGNGGNEGGSGGNNGNGGGNEGGAGNGEGNGNRGNGGSDGGNNEFQFDRTDNPEDPYHTPNNIQQLCQEIADSAPELWGPHGRFPVITGEKPYRTIPTQNGTTQLYDANIDNRVINTANMVRWMRNGESGGMMYLHNDSPDENHNFLQRVGLHVRKGKLTPDISLQTILYTQDKFFRTANHQKQYNDLVEQMKREVFFFTARRQVRIAYEIENNEMGADTKLASRIIQINAGNTFTKRIWNDESAYAHTFGLSQNYFTEADPIREEYGNKPDLPVNDGLMGKAIATAFLTYKNIADYKTLEEIHNTKDEDGNNVISPFFKLETFLKIRDKLAEGANINKAGKAITPQDYISDETLKAIFYMPRETPPNGKKVGDVKNPSAFIAYVNFFKEAEVNPRKVKMVQNLVKATLVDSADLYLKELDREGRTIVDEHGNPIYARETVYEMKDGKRVPKLAKNEQGENIPEWETEDKVVGGLVIRKYKELNGQRIPAKDENGNIKYQHEYVPEYEMEEYIDDKGFPRKREKVITVDGEKKNIPKRANGQLVYKKIVDETNLDMSEAYAFTMPRPTLTAAAADTANQAYDAATKPLLVKDYRVKSIGQQLEEGHITLDEDNHDHDEHGGHADHDDTHEQDEHHETVPFERPADAKVIELHHHEKFKKNRRRRGRAYGLSKDMHLFKRLGMDFTVGAHTVIIDQIRTSEDPNNAGFVKKDEHGNKIPLTINGKVQRGKNNQILYEMDYEKLTDDDTIHYKTMNDVMWELHKASNKMTQEAIEERHNIAFQLAFPANTEKNWAQNHIARAFEMYHRLLNATEIDFHKFSEYDPIRGITTFKKAEFQKVLGDELIKPWSYLLSTWKQLDMSQDIRTQVDQFDPVTGLFTGKKWETTSVAEAMFGYEILNTPEFWADGKDLPDLFQYEKAVDENGHEYMKMKRDPRGKPLRKIDPYKVNAQKELLYIQIVKAILSAQFAEAKDKYSGHKEYELSYWNHIYEALEAIPMFIEGDEFSMLHTRALGNFFTHHDIQWIREHSSTESGRLYMEAYRRAFIVGFGSGLAKAGGKIFEGMTAGII